MNPNKLIIIAIIINLSEWLSLWFIVILAISLYDRAMIDAVW